MRFACCTLPECETEECVVRCKPDAVSASGLRCNRPATRLNTSFLRRLPGVRDDFLHCAGGCVLQEQALLLVRASGLSACAVHLILFPTPKMTMKKKRAIKDRSDIYSFSCAVFKQATTAWISMYISMFSLYHHQKSAITKPYIYAKYSKNNEYLSEYQKQCLSVLHAL